MTKQYQEAGNRIDRLMTIDGDVLFTGITLVEGTINGNVSGERIIVAETGVLVGDLTVKEVFCHGRITGTIIADSISVGHSASVKAQLEVTTIEIESGAELDCQIERGKKEGEKKKAATSVLKKVTRTVTKNKKPVAVKKTKATEKKDEKPPVAKKTKVVDTKEEKPVVAKAVESAEIKEEKRQKQPENKGKQKQKQDQKQATVAGPVSMESLESTIFFPEGERRGIVRSIVELVQSSNHRMVKVIGDMGSGKTTVCDKIVGELMASCEVVCLDDVIGSIRELFGRIAEKLGIEVEDNSSQTDILEKLKKHMAGNGKKRVVLALDNSHEMYPATLEGVIKKLGSIFTDETNRLRILLFGEEYLDRHLDPKTTTFFSEHPECSYTLRPLSQGETRRYIDFRLEMIRKCTNSEKPIDFPDESADKVYLFSQGIIGKTDRIVERAIEAAGKKKSNTVVAKFIVNI